jgi:hypothetical protein
MRFELVNDVGDVDGGVVVVCDAVGGTGRGGNVVGLAGETRRGGRAGKVLGGNGLSYSLPMGMLSFCRTLVVLRGPGLEVARSHCRFVHRPWMRRRSGGTQ